MKKLTFAIVALVLVASVLPERKAMHFVALGHYWVGVSCVELHYRAGEAHEVNVLRSLDPKLSLAVDQRWLDENSWEARHMRRKP